MRRIPRKSDGRRIFTATFKRDQIARVVRGELSIAALARELDIAPSLLHRWRRGTSPRETGRDPVDTRPVPVGRLGTARYIRELQVLVGKQMVELELLRAEVSALRTGQRRRRSSRG